MHVRFTMSKYVARYHYFVYVISHKRAVPPTVREEVKCRVGG